MRIKRKRDRFTLQEYAAVCSALQNVGGGDWPFRVNPSREKDEAFFRLLQGHSATARKLLPKLRSLRRLVPQFLSACADEVLAGNPDVVGFTTVYSQTWPNAALAHLLKKRRPELFIVFGGASCEGSMGRAMLEAVPWIEAVVRGEAENVLVPLLEAAAHGGQDFSTIPNVCYRDESGAVVESDAEGSPVDMDSVPVPDYFEFFERLEHCPTVQSSVEVQLPVELSRGCWWGAKNHCTFCGLNGLEMALRRKSPDKAFDLVVELARCHKRNDFTATDNILPLEYFDTLLPRLAEADIDLAFFYEVKANMRREQVALLRSSGVRTIQPGIESISSPVLALMRKGATAIQNARLLKWSAEYGIGVIWNLLYGFPGETREHYKAMASMIPSLVHLTPPNLSQVMVYRFSPYFERAEEYGLKVERPLPYYELLYDLDEDSLWDLAQAFEHSFTSGRRAHDFIGPVADEVARWQRDSARNYRGLMYRRGPGFLTVTDTRTTTANGRGVLRYELDDAHARTYLACDAGAKPETLARELELDLGEVRSILDEFVEARLMLEDEGRFLSLAIANN